MESTARSICPPISAAVCRRILDVVTNSIHIALEYRPRKHVRGEVAVAALRAAERHRNVNTQEAYLLIIPPRYYRRAGQTFSILRAPQPSILRYPVNGAAGAVSSRATLKNSMSQEEEVLGKAYDSRLMARLLKYLRPYRWQVAIALVSIVLKSFADVLGPYLTKVAIDRYLAPAKGCLPASGAGSARAPAPASRRSRRFMSDCWSSAFCSSSCKPTSCSGPGRK